MVRLALFTGDCHSFLFFLLLSLMGANITSCLLGNAGHVWPAGDYTNASFVSGPLSTDLDTTAAVLRFFGNNPVVCGVCPPGTWCQPWGVCGTGPHPAPFIYPIADIIIGSVVGGVGLAVLITIAACCYRASRRRMERSRLLSNERSSGARMQIQEDPVSGARKVRFTEPSPSPVASASSPLSPVSYGGF